MKGLEKWQSLLRYDPLPKLLSSKNQAIVFFTKHDLQEEKSESVETLWELPSAVKAVERQQSDGSWKYHGGKPDIRSQQNYNQLETYRILANLQRSMASTTGTLPYERLRTSCSGFKPKKETSEEYTEPNTPRIILAQ